MAASFALAWQAANDAMVDDRFTQALMGACTTPSSLSRISRLTQSLTMGNVGGSGVQCKAGCSERILQSVQIYPGQP